MPLEDRYGLALTTSSPAARDAYVTGVDRLLAAQPGPDAAFETAIGEDPGFALAHCALARVLQLNNRMPEARESVARARELAAQATARERSHVAVFEHMFNGRGPQAIALTSEHLAEHPRDAVALSPSVGVFGLYGFSGRQDREPALAALLESVASHYGDDWWFLSAHAFAMIENGETARGRDLVERSLAQMSGNANAVHIRGHALYELAEDDTARDFLAAWLPGYAPEGKLHGHLGWHLALLHLFAGDVPAMWQAYEAHCLPGHSPAPPINVFTDGVSLLWRARLAGVTCDRARWLALRDYAEQQFPTPGIFVDVHYGFCLAALGDDDALARFRNALGEAEAAGRVLAGAVVGDIVDAAAAFAQGDMRRVTGLLEPALERTVRIGGSRAQRDLVLCTLVSAYLALDDLPSAQAVLDRRDARARGMALAGAEKLTAGSPSG